MTLSLFDLKKQLTPQQFAEHLMSMGPISWWAPGHFWLVTDYQLAKSLLSSEQVTCDRSPFFISRMPNIELSLLSDFFDVVSNMMVMKDGHSHKSSRRICYHGFANYHINRLKPKIESTIFELLNNIKSKTSFDFTTEYANVIPMKTLADFFNIPQSDRAQFVEYAKTMTAFFGGFSQYRNEDAIEVNHAAKTLKQYFTDLYQLRVKNLQQDFFSELIKHQKEFGLSMDDIIAQAIMMWVAGMVTTSDQMANNGYTLFSEFSEYSRDNLDINQYQPLIEECSRLDPAVTFTFRLAAEDITIGKHTMKKGETIFISNHAVNRDRELFTQPNRIELARQAKHLSYGHGPHFCLGAKLSLIEMQMAFYYLIKEKPNLQVIDHKRLHYSLSFSGFEKLILCSSRP